MVAWTQRGSQYFEERGIMDAERLDRIIKAVRDELKSGTVCDSVLKCEGWETNARLADAVINEWKYCPWCSKEILKGEG